jgi:hypothetical protein
VTERLPPVGPSALVTASGKPNPEVMAIRARGSAPGSAPAGRSSEVEQWAAKRQLYVDNLKVILIAAVIAGHAILGYSELDAWSYADVREVTLRPAVAYALLAVAAPFALLVIPPAVSDRGTADATVAGSQGSWAFYPGPIAAPWRAVRGFRPAAVAAVGVCLVPPAGRSTRALDLLPCRGELGHRGLMVRRRAADPFRSGTQVGFGCDGVTRLGRGWARLRWVICFC